MRDLDWRAHGFEGRTLSHLLARMGWFYDAQRAQTDVDALLHLLDQRSMPERRCSRRSSSRRPHRFG